MKDFTFLYTSDLHGSDLCFKKTINAAINYKVGAVLIGGDLAGKSLTPIIRKAGGFFESEVAGRKERARTGGELEEMRLAIANSGSYFIVLSEEEYECAFVDEHWRKKTFDLLMMRRLKQWLWVAEYKLKPKDIRLIIICGNDDPWFLDRAIRASSFAENPEYKEVVIGDGHEVLAESRGNLPSPFDCPRDMDESKLEESIRKKLVKIKNVGQAIFMLHIPPVDTMLDKAYELDKEKRVKTEGPSVLQKSVGSKAVRTIIEEQQPLIGLHGHIHESPGSIMIGRTTCFNPGSDHHQGLMRAFLITLGRDQIKTYSPITA